MTAVNDTVYIEAAGTGASTDYSYSSSTTWNTSVFSQPSFQISPASGNLTGGANAGTTKSQVYAYSITTPGGASGYDPVGNVVNYSDSVMGVWTSAIGIQSCTTNGDQQSGYDCLNRLTSLHNTTTTATSTQYAGEYVCWSYDALATGPRRPYRPPLARRKRACRPRLITMPTIRSPGPRSTRPPPGSATTPRAMW